MLKSWYIGFFQIPRLADWLFSIHEYAGAARVLIGSGKPGTFTNQDIEVYKKAWSQPGALTRMIHWYRALVPYRSATPVDYRVHMPVLMLWGKQDVALSHEMAQPSIDLCDQGRLVFFEEASHWVQHDAAEKVNELLLEFLML